MVNKFLIAILLSSVIGIADARPVIVPAPADIQAVYDRLKAAAGHDADISPYIEVNRSMPVANAFTFPNYEIMIWQGEINFDRGHPGFMAATIAHELGHVVHRDQDASRNWVPTIIKEKEADLYSVHLLKDAGYDPCVAADYYVEMMKIQGPGFGGGTHPNNIDRERYMRQECHK